MPFWLILFISEMFEMRMDDTRNPTPSNRYLKKKEKKKNQQENDKWLLNKALF